MAVRWKVVFQKTMLPTMLSLLILAHFVNGSNKLNILLLVIDDFRPLMGCYGYNMVTPNMDQLAAKSVRFNKAYAQQALCSPSRTSMLTSRRPDSTRCLDNHKYWRKIAGNYTTIPQHFKNNGYKTISLGKIFHPGSASGHDDWRYSWSDVPYHPPSEKYRRSKVCGGPSGYQYEDIVCPVDVHDQPGGTLPDIETTLQAIDTIHSLQGGEQPFFLAVGFHKPHIPLKYPEQYAELYPLSEVHPAPDPHLPDKLPCVAWNPWTDLRARDDVKLLNVSFPYGPLPVHYQRLVRQSYYASISYVDDQVGKILESLTSAGLSDNTVIVLLGDHGWSLGEHQEWSKYSNYDVSTRVPLLISVPQLTGNNTTFTYINPIYHYTSRDNKQHQSDNHQSPDQPTSLKTEGHQSDVFVELVDIFPTLTDITNIPAIPQCPHVSLNVTLCTEGRSFMKVIQHQVETGRDVEWKKAVFSQYPRPSDIPQYNSDQPRTKDITIMGYTIRTASYRYTEWLSYDIATFTADWAQIHARELYAEQSDPTEDNNVVDDESYGDIVEYMSHLLRRGWRYAL